MWGSLCGSLPSQESLSFNKHEVLCGSLINEAFSRSLPKREALLGEFTIPIELQDCILLFLEGHERADLGIKTVVNPVKVPPEIRNIVRKLELYECRTMFRVDRRHTIFIEKLDTEGLNGYVSKMIQDNLIHYHWIRCCDTLKEMRRKINIYSNTVEYNASDFQGQNAVQHPL